MKFTIPGELPDLNTYINAERSNRYMAAKIKKESTQAVWWIAKRLQPITTKVKAIFTWITADERKDPDNVAFAKKFILDGLVQAGVLKNDGRKQIEGLEDRFGVDKQNPRVEVELMGAGQNEVLERSREDKRT